MFGHQSNNDQASGHHNPSNDAPTNGIEPETVAPTAVADAPAVDPADLSAPVATDPLNESVNNQLSQQINQRVTDPLVTDDAADYALTEPAAADQTQQAQQPVSAGAPPMDDPASVPPVAEPVPEAQQPAPQPETAPVQSDYDLTPVAPATTPVQAVSVATPEQAAPIAAHTAIDANELLSIKQSALHDLSPLLGELEQTPEERFRTTMMMIQASDDQTLLQTAYDAAKAITDERVRAQALLDVVNEINYFTQQSAGDDNPQQQ